MFLFLLTNWKSVLIGIATLVLGLTIGYKFGNFTGNIEGGKAAVARGVMESAKIREQQNEVRNLRPDTDEFLNGMRNGQF